MVLPGIRYFAKKRKEYSKYTLLKILMYYYNVINALREGYVYEVCY